MSSTYLQRFIYSSRARYPFSSTAVSRQQQSWTGWLVWAASRNTSPIKQVEAKKGMKYRLQRLKTVCDRQWQVMQNLVSIMDPTKLNLRQFSIVCSGVEASTQRYSLDMRSKSYQYLYLWIYAYFCQSSLRWWSSSASDTSWLIDFLVKVVRSIWMGLSPPCLRGELAPIYNYGQSAIVTEANNQNIYSIHHNPKTVGYASPNILGNES